MDPNNEFRDAILEELPKIASDSIAYFKKAIESNNIILTGELLDSFSVSIEQEAGSISADIHFASYGRYKDMKGLRWSGNMPNFDAIESFVEKKGLASFAYVPGYENALHFPADTIAIKRIAFGIAKAMSDLDIVKRKYKGSWYNEQKAKMVNVAKGIILKRLQEITAKTVAKIINV